MRIQNPLIDLAYQREHRLSELDRIRSDVRSALRETKAKKEGSTVHGGGCARKQQSDSILF